MKTTKNITLIGAIAFLLISCEKENLNTGDNSLSKNKIQNSDKSGTIPGLQDFIDDVIEDEVSPGNLSLIDAILFTEAGLNFEFANTTDELIEYDSYMIETDLTTTATISSGTVDGTTLLNFYKDLKDEINTLGTTNYNAGDRYVAGIDIEFYEDFDPKNISVQVVFARNFPPPPINSCAYYGDYYIIDNDGPCGNGWGLNQNSDAQNEISKRVSSTVCNSCFDLCDPGMFYFDLEIWPNLSQYSQRTYDEIWNYYESTDPDACMTEAQQLTIEQNIEAWLCLHFLHTTHWGTVIGVKRNWVEEHPFKDQRVPGFPKPDTWGFKHKRLRAYCALVVQSALIPSF